MVTEDNLSSSQSIIRVIESRIMRWGGERYLMYFERRGSYGVLVEKHEGKSNSEDLEVDGRMILK
jgi:hypothetical protein